MTEGFALDEYITPRHGFPKVAPACTIPKASLDVGGLFADVQNSTKVPGPEQYNKDFLNKSFAIKARGGTFSKLNRDWGKTTAKSPAVGQYDTINPQKTKIKGGIMSKRDRGCYFLEAVLKPQKDNPAPGKYNGVAPTPHLQSPAFSSSQTESRNPQKPSAVGPGFYHLNYGNVEKSSVSYSGSKDAKQSFIQQHIKGKDKMPAPGHNGIPESKVEDRGGRSKHAARLLGDRIVTPRIIMGAGVSTAASV